MIIHLCFKLNGGFVKPNLKPRNRWKINIGVLMRFFVNGMIWHKRFAWWRHQMETFSALLAICAVNSPVTGEFRAQRPVTLRFEVFFYLHLNKRLSDLRRHRAHYEAIVMAKGRMAVLTTLKLLCICLTFSCISTPRGRWSTCQVIFTHKFSFLAYNRFAIFTQPFTELYIRQSHFICCNIV